MKILIVWRGLPNPTHPSYYRPYYFIKHNKNHEITLFSLNLPTPVSGNKKEFLDIITSKCSHVRIVDPKRSNKRYIKILQALGDRVTIQNLLFSQNFNPLKGYEAHVDQELFSLVSSEKFDIIYADYRMTPYLYGIKKRKNIPIVLQFFAPTHYHYRRFYQETPRLIQKVDFLLKYYSEKMECPRYVHFDAGIYVSKIHLNLSRPYIPRMPFLLPPGIDIEYYKPTKEDDYSQSLIFVGSMDYYVNIDAVLYFYRNIWPIIKKEVPQVKFYIVGRNPSAEIKHLTQKDPSIIVTGSVKDIRPYLRQASVFINPIRIFDGGFKTKLLEPMAMKKPVVSSLIGAIGIEAKNEKEILIENSPQKFAEGVIYLLENEKVRTKMGENARKLIETHYSWSVLIKKLNNILETVAVYDNINNKDLSY